MLLGIKITLSSGILLMLSVAAIIADGGDDPPLWYQASCIIGFVGSGVITLIGLLTIIWSL